MLGLKYAEMEGCFRHPSPRRVQSTALQFIAEAETGLTLEMPTGSGKTDVGIAMLRAAQAKGECGLFYVTPTKAQVAQIHQWFPDEVTRLFGRNDHSCLYYNDKGKEVNAAESPCHMLKCPHRVNQETGETAEPGVEPCPYLRDKHEALSGNRIILCTTAFFLMNRVMVGGWREREPTCVVVDEAHNLARITRGLFEYTITDWHLNRAIRILKAVNLEQEKILTRFKKSFSAMARIRAVNQRTLLEYENISRLIEVLDDFDAGALSASIHQALDEGLIDPVEQRGELKLLENLVRNIPRLLRSLKYSIPEDDRQPLNYVIAFYFRAMEDEEYSPRRRVTTYLTIKAYYVAPLIRRAFGDNVIAQSATIGRAEIFGHETGLRMPFHSFASNFSPDHTRLYIPRDAPDLAFARGGRQRVSIAYRMILDAVSRFVEAGHRSMAVVVSDREREQLLEHARRSGIAAVSYGNGITARGAFAQFVAGEGTLLVGTAAHFSEGIDLPDGICPIIFFLRPGYPPPTDPEVVFEERRFTRSRAWALRNWRLTIEAMQVRGRNVRSVRDRGICFFMSSGFDRFLFPGLPDWLKPSFSNQRTMAEAVEETLQLLSK